MFSHKFFTCVLLLAAFLLVFSQTEPLVAQVPGILGLPKMSAEFKMPKVGTYVKYKSTNEKTKTESILKLSIVGKEKLEGEGEFFWYEIEQTEPKTGGVTIIKMLISGDPKDLGTVKRMIFKSGKEPANELPQAFVNLMNQALPKDTTKAAEPKTKKLGTEKIKTKMGTFSCVHTQSTSPYNQVTDSWTNAEVPMFGMVKSTSGSNTLVLLEHGTGAVTAVKEKPELLEMPGQK
ncbi:MAG: hypothetical protein KAW16_06505 [candidate division Zixibacteria bacterium]|nr:hypothetical protein [candidate division Zixibacteria bacterium]